ncbi:MAG: hypothetical protein ABIH23_14565 [bacterium]
MLDNPVKTKGAPPPELVRDPKTSSSATDEETCTPEKDPFLKDYDREAAAFEALLPELIRSKPGCFVAFHNEEIVDEDGDEFALAERIERRFRDTFVLVRQVSQSAIEDHIESPETEE